MAAFIIQWSFYVRCRLGQRCGPCMQSTAIASTMIEKRKDRKARSPPCASRSWFRLPGWIVDRRDIQPLRELGRGAFGAVRLVSWF